MLSREDAFVFRLPIYFIHYDNYIDPPTDVVPQIKKVIDYIGKTKKFKKRLKTNSKICRKPLKTIKLKSYKRFNLNQKTLREIAKEQLEYYSPQTIQLSAQEIISILQNNTDK